MGDAVSKLSTRYPDTAGVPIIPIGVRVQDRAPIPTIYRYVSVSIDVIS